MTTKRSPIEESMLLPAPVKVAVVLLSSVVHLLKGFSLEQAIGILLTFIGAVLALIAWSVSSAKLRNLALIAFTLGTFCIFLLGPAPSGSVPVLPKFDRNDPPVMPAAGTVTRDSIITNGVDGFFREKSTNRVVLLRGVNFGASTKIPSADDATHIKTADFYTKHKDVSFVGRPCPLAEADEHFARLSSFGFNVVRLLITWEAVEHDGPGLYDYGYLDFLKQLCKSAAKYGISAYIDPHQDVWSRFTGGDGAPGWTLEKVGFKLSSELFETGAAFTHQEFGDPFPRMSWPTNYARLATATMFTLFFAGEEFAPKTRIGDVSAQEYLQGHYIAAMREVAKVLKDEKNVLGFDSLNEPSNGYVGLEDLRLSIFPIPLAYHMSAFDGMILGAGYSRRVDFFSVPFIFNRTEVINPEKKTAWVSPEQDVWRANGVWEIGADGEPVLLRPAHFKLPPNTSFVKRYMLPFFNRMTQEIRKEAPDLIMFAEPHIEPREPVHHHSPTKEMLEASKGSYVWVPHYYDGITLMFKDFFSWFALDTKNKMIVLGSIMAKKVFATVAAGLRAGGEGLPVLIGETGVPMDIRGNIASGDFSKSARALDRVLRAMESEFLSWTLWTYTPDNTNERGDLWNGEDFSLWSMDQVTDKTDLLSGGRGLSAAVRPYPMKMAGQPLETSFDAFDDKRRFYLKLRVPLSGIKSSETLLFIPQLHYHKGIEWRVGGKGSSSLAPLPSIKEQGFIWTHSVSTNDAAGDSFVDQWIEIEAKL